MSANVVHIFINATELQKFYFFRRKSIGILAC